MVLKVYRFQKRAFLFTVDGKTKTNKNGV